jgi:murein DD-endopeptidase MepM/ murein hydrolase activator NlpD
MPGSPWPKFFWLKEIKKLTVRYRCPTSGSIYAAAGMTIVVAVLLFTVIGGLKYNTQVAPKVNLAESDAATPQVQVERQETAPVTETITAKTKTNAAVDDSLAVKSVRPNFTGAQRPLRPVQGKVRQEFGWNQHPVYNDWRYHPGIDIETPAGSTVSAMLDGEVTSIIEDRNYGLTVVVSSGPYTVYYGSLATVNIAKGQYIAAGAKIGTVGSCNAEPYLHLHLAVKTGEKYANPQDILSKAQ